MSEANATPVLRRDHPTSRDVPTLICDSRAWVEAEHYDRVHLEVERLREALTRIYQSGRGQHVEIARDALNA
jgi:hypothetical protein